MPTRATPATQRPTPATQIPKSPQTPMPTVRPQSTWLRTRARPMKQRLTAMTMATRVGSSRSMSGSPRLRSRRTTQQNPLRPTRASTVAMRQQPVGAGRKTDGHAGHARSRAVPTQTALTKPARTNQTLRRPTQTRSTKTRWTLRLSRPQAATRTKSLALRCRRSWPNYWRQLSRAPSTGQTMGSMHSTPK